jgi:hypothetical protein
MASRSNIMSTKKGGLRTATALMGGLQVAPVTMICGPAYDGADKNVAPRTEAQEKAKTARINRILKGKEP